MNTTPTLLGAAALSIGLLSASGAQAALQSRLGGLAVYDTDLNITWLANANVNSARDWAAANTWAAGLTVGGLSGWRLPISLQVDAACDAQGVNYSAGHNCTGSEMGHLFYNELGGVADQSINATHNVNYGLFQNFQDYYYWSATQNANDVNLAWNFIFLGGTQHASYLAGYKLDTMYALAVHPGDVAAVPEPQTWAMLLAGLALVGAATRWWPWPAGTRKMRRPGAPRSLDHRIGR